MAVQGQLQQGPSRITCVYARRTLTRDLNAGAADGSSEQKRRQGSFLGQEVELKFGSKSFALGVSVVPTE